MMKPALSILRRMLLPAVILVLLVVGYRMVRAKSSASKETVTYEFGTVTRGDVRSSVTATGTIQPWKIVDIKSNVAGKIEKLTVDLGDRVKSGDLIALIDPTDTQVAVDQAQADLNSAIARRRQAVVNAEQQKLQSRARVVSVERSLQSARARLAQSRVNMIVQPKLTVSNIRQADASLASARKSVVQSQQSKKQLQEQLRQLREVTIPRNRETADASVSEAQANFDTAEADHRRQKELLTKGFVSKSAVETAYSRMMSAQSALRNAQRRESTLDDEQASMERELLSRIDEAQSRIEESQARVEQAQAARQVASDNRYQDDVRMYETTAARAAVKQAEAELASARAELNQIVVRQQEIQAAQAQLVRGDAALKQAVTNLAYTKIVAPRGGIVIAKNVEEGTVVPSSRGSIGSTNALLQIGDVSKLWVVCLVDETDIGQVSVDQKVTVKIDAYPSMLIDGKVIRIDPQAKLEQNVTMIPVTVEILDPDERFKPGMSAECEFIVDEVTNTLAVPNEALKESDGVYTVQKLVGGAPKDFEVEVGVAGPDTTEIRSGLEEGDQVITRTIEPEASQVNNPFQMGPPGGRGGRGGPGGGTRGGGGPGGGGGMRGGGGR